MELNRLLLEDRKPPRTIDAKLSPAKSSTRNVLRLVIKAHDLDPSRSVLHVLLSDRLTGNTRTIERVTSDAPQRLFDFCAAEYPGVRILSALNYGRKHLRAAGVINDSRRDFSVLSMANV